MNAVEPSHLAIPTDLSTCQALIQELHTALEQAQRRTRQLEHRLEQLLRARFGPRSDRLDRSQMLLTFAQELIEQAQPSSSPESGPPSSSHAARSRNGHGRRRFPAELPRQEIVHDLSEAQKCCPGCGQTRVKIGQETSEQLEYEPARLYVIEHVRPTYACRHCEGQVETASKPLQPIEKGAAGPGLLAAVITNKFSDHLPLYRQEAILHRSGYEVPRSTMCGWLASCAALLKPLYERMKNLILASKVIHTDDTPVPVLDEKRGKTREGRLWVYVGDASHPYTVFDYTPTRSRDGPTKFFGSYAGYIQADAYSGYDHLFKPNGDGAPLPTEVACWAHARRKFVEAQSSDALRACAAVALIKRLYEVEGQARTQIQSEALALDALDLSMAAAARARMAAIRRELRQAKSAPLLAQIQAWLGEQKDQVLPRSPIGEAIGYCRGNWTALQRYAEDGDLAIDNNPAENAIRPIVLGRKNWLFAGSDNGGRSGATLASLIVSCKRHGVDPFAYLRDVLMRIAATPVSQLDPFLPDRWQAARTAASTVA